MSYADYMETKMKLAKSRIMKMLNADLKLALISATERSLNLTYLLRAERVKLEGLQVELTQVKELLYESQRAPQSEAKSFEDEVFGDVKEEPKKFYKKKEPQVLKITLSEWIKINNKGLHGIKAVRFDCADNLTAMGTNRTGANVYKETDLNAYLTPAKVRRYLVDTRKFSHL